MNTKCLWFKFYLFFSLLFIPKKKKNRDQTKLHYLFYTINNKIFCLGFNFLSTKNPSHKFLNSLKYTPIF